MSLSEFLQHYLCARLCDLFLFHQVIRDTSPTTDFVTKLKQAQLDLIMIQHHNENLSNLIDTLYVQMFGELENVVSSTNNCFFTTMLNQPEYPTNYNRFLLFETPSLSVLEFLSGRKQSNQVVVPELGLIGAPFVKMLATDAATELKAEKSTASIPELMSVLKVIPLKETPVLVGLKFRDKFFSTMSPYVTMFFIKNRGVGEKDVERTSISVVNEHGVVFTGFRYTKLGTDKAPRWVLALFYQHARYCQILDWLYPAINSNNERFILER